MRECLKASASILPSISKASKDLRMVSSSSVPPAILEAKGDHLGEVHGSVSLIKHALGLTAGDIFAMVSEGSHEIISGEKAVLVDVHDTESLLELLDGRVGEGVENVGLLGHGDVFVLEAAGDKNYNGVKR